MSSIEKERKIGDCGLCKKKDIEGETSEYIVGFMCVECIKIRDIWNSLDSTSMFPERRELKKMGYSLEELKDI